MSLLSKVRLRSMRKLEMEPPSYFPSQQVNVRTALGSFRERAGVLGSWWDGHFRALVRAFQVRAQLPSGPGRCWPPGPPEKGTIYFVPHVNESPSARASWGSLERTVKKHVVGRGPRKEGDVGRSKRGPQRVQAELQWTEGCGRIKTSNMHAVREKARGRHPE